MQESNVSKYLNGCHVKTALSPLFTCSQRYLKVYLSFYQTLSATAVRQWSFTYRHLLNAKSKSEYWAQSTLRYSQTIVVPLGKYSTNEWRAADQWLKDPLNSSAL